MNINKRFLRWLPAALALFVIMGAVGFGIAIAMRSAAKPVDTSHIINLLSDRADPSAIAVTKGSYVQFNAKDNQKHNLAQGSGDDEVHQQANQNVHDHAAGGKESGEFGPSEAYRVTFNQIGTFSFHDHNNPKISISVVVYEPKK